MLLAWFGLLGGVSPALATPLWRMRRLLIAFTPRRIKPHRSPIPPGAGSLDINNARTDQ
jgi:hypothetical protein